MLHLLNLMLQRNAASLRRVRRSHRLLALVYHVAALFSFCVLSGEDFLARLLFEVRIFFEDLRHIFLACACHAVAARVRVDLVTVAVLVLDGAEALTLLAFILDQLCAGTDAKVERLGRLAVRRQCRGSTLMRLPREELAVLRLLVDAGRVELRH